MVFYTIKMLLRCYIIQTENQDHFQYQTALQKWGHYLLPTANNAFRYCTSLTSITIPSSVKNIDYYAFSDNPGLKSVIMNPVVPPVVHTSLLPFANCKSLIGGGAIKVPNGSLDAYHTASGWSSYKNITDIQ
jgi:hypothetical protein